MLDQMRGFALFRALSRDEVIGLACSRHRR